MGGQRVEHPVAGRSVEARCFYACHSKGFGAGVPLLPLHPLFLLLFLPLSQGQCACPWSHGCKGALGSLGGPGLSRLKLKSRVVQLRTSFWPRSEVLCLSPLSPLPFGSGSLAWRLSCGALCSQVEAHVMQESRGR